MFNIVLPYLLKVRGDKVTRLLNFFFGKNEVNSQYGQIFSFEH